MTKLDKNKPKKPSFFRSHFPALLRRPKVIHLLPGQHFYKPLGKFGETMPGGVELSGVLEHKSDNISETRKDRGRVTKWRAYRNYPPSTLFRTVSPTCNPKIRGSQPYQSPLSQDRVKIRTSDLAGTFTGSIRTKVH